MRLKGAKQVHYDSGPNMTPLVDVVMVILIFLMLAGSFGGSSLFLSSNLPIVKGGVGGVAAGDLAPVILEVRIDPDPTYGFKVTADNIRTYGTTEGLQDAFAKKRDQYVNVAGTKPEEIQVVLYPAQNVKYESVAKVYQAALKAGFPKIAFHASR